MKDGILEEKRLFGKKQGIKMEDFKAFGKVNIYIFEKEKLILFSDKRRGKKRQVTSLPEI